MSSTEPSQPITDKPVAVTSPQELARLQDGIGAMASVFPPGTAGFSVLLFATPGSHASAAPVAVTIQQELDRLQGRIGAIASVFPPAAADFGINLFVR